MYLQQLKLVCMTLVRVSCGDPIKNCNSSIHCFKFGNHFKGMCEDFFRIEIDEIILFLISAIICQTGIGAGLETMSINPMGLEGPVNPRVC